MGILIASRSLWFTQVVQRALWFKCSFTEYLTNSILLSHLYNATEDSFRQFGSEFPKQVLA